MNERTTAAISILKELKKAQEKSDMAGFSFLSYLVQMATLEAQAIASGEKAGPDWGAKARRADREY